MQILEIHRHGELLRSIPVGPEPLELGSHHRCDVVLDDPEIDARHMLVMEQNGTLMTLRLQPGPRSRRQPRPLAIGRPLILGEHQLVRRSPRRGAGGLDRETETLARTGAGELALVVGRGSEARRVTLGREPITVGRGSDSDVELLDRAMSAQHFRLEPRAGGLRLRDLDSHNGTCVNGVRVAVAELRVGDVVRAGRSEMFVVEASSRDGSRAAPIAAAARSHALLAEARRYAQLPWPALVLGESGSGKEGMAELLHREGPRAAGPFVALNAGGVPAELIESELFGHERGAFTGAANMRRGVFEQADGGTLFLDEIGELPMALQARLLRVLETGELRRVGAEESRRVDVRLVCATHRDLHAMVASGQFRQDLLYRIARLVLRVPPLRERPEDIAALAQHFLHEVRDVIGPRELSTEAAERLQAHSWPGNARELRNVLTAAAADTSAPVLEWLDIERALRRLGGGTGAPSDEQLRRVVEQHRGNYAAAARVLGMPRTTLRDRMRASIV